MADFDIKKITDNGVKFVKKNPALVIGGIVGIAALVYFTRGKEESPMVPGFLDYGYSDGDLDSGISESDLQALLAGYEAENIQKMQDFQYQVGTELQRLFEGLESRQYQMDYSDSYYDDLPRQSVAKVEAAPGSVEWQVENILSTPSIRLTDSGFNQAQIKTISDWASQEQMAIQQQAATGQGIPGGTSKIIRDPSLVQVFHADGTVSFKPYEAKTTSKTPKQKTAEQASAAFKQAQNANNVPGMVQAMKDYNIATGTAPAGGY